MAYKFVLIQISKSREYLYCRYNISIILATE